MNTSDYSHSSRTFVACFVTCLMILGQLAPLASAAASTRRAPENKGSSAKVNPNPAPVALPPAIPAPLAAPFAVGITATKVDSYPSSPGPALPGETISYTVTITNSGSTTRLVVS